MSLTLDESRAMDRGIDSIKEDERVEKLKSFDEKMRASGLETNGPSADSYDYKQAHVDGVSFDETPEGGRNLPNKYMKTTHLGGYDMSGKKVANFDDPQNLGKMGAEGIRNSFTNTQSGIPAKDYEHVSYLAANHMQNGGSIDTFEAPFDDKVKQQAFDLVDAEKAIYAKEQMLRSLPDEPEEPATQETITLEQIHGDEEWMSDAAIIAEWKGVEEDYKDVDPEDLSEDLIQEMSALKMSFSKMATLVYAIEAGDMPDQVREAYGRVLKKHEALTNMSKDVVLGWVSGILRDAPLYATGGGIGTATARMGTKSAAVKALMKMLATKTGAKATMAKAGAVAGGVGAIEGTAFGGMTEGMEQAVAGEGYDYGKIKEQAMWGGVGGALIGGAFGAALSKPGREGIVAAYNRIAEHDWSGPGKIAGQHGHVKFHISEKTKEVAPPPPIEPKDFGVVMADTMKSGSAFTSRVANNVTGRWKETFGKKAKEIDAEKLLGALDTWQQKPHKDIEGFAKYEVDNMGLRPFLENKQAAGEKVSLEEVEDYMFANRPRVNVLVSTPTDYTAPGSMYYRNRGTETAASIRKSRGTEAMAQRMFDIEPVQRDIDPTPFHKVADSYYEDMAAWDTYVAKSQELDGGPQNLFPEDEIIAPKKPEVSPHISRVNPAFKLEVEAYARNRSMAAMEGKPFTQPKPQLVIPPKTDYRLTNKATGEVEDFASEGQAKLAANDQSRNLVKDLSDEEVIQLVREYDEQRLTAPVKWGKEITIDGKKQTLTIVPGENSNNYKEMRLLIPYDGLRNESNIAMERFGKSLDDLTDAEKARVSRIKQYATVPEVPFMEPHHFPVEMNRLSHVRMQDVYLKDGTKVLGVNEMQSDLAQTTGRYHPQQKVSDEMIAEGENKLREAAEKAGVEPDFVDKIFAFARENVDPGVEIDGAPPSNLAETLMRYTENEYGKQTANKMRASIKRVFMDRPGATVHSFQPDQGMEQMTLNRIFQHAVENGYNAVSLPVDEKMLQRVEGWSDEALAENQGLVNYYQNILPKLIQKDKKMLKRWGIDAKKGFSTEVVNTAAEGGTELEKMLIIRINADKIPAGPRAVYGTAAVATSTGATMMEGNELEGGDL